MVFVLLLKDNPIMLVTLFMSLFLSTFFILTFVRHKKWVGNPKIKHYPKVSIIIPAYKRASSLSASIENALNFDWPKNKIEFIVVENGNSQDGTYEIAKSYEKRGVIVYQLKEGNKGKAMNYAIKRCTGDIIISMDSDTYAQKDILRKLIPYFDDPKVMASSPAIVAWNPKTFAQKVQNIEYLFGVFLRKVFHFLGSVYVTPGAFTAYRKSFFKKYGYYDTTNITEDFELCLRIQSEGFKVTNSINSLVYTHTPETFRALHKQRLRWFVGFIDTAIQHRKLFFNPKRGLLGILILPSAVFSIALTLILFSKITWNFVMQIINTTKNYQLSQALNFKPYLYSIKWDLFYYRINAVLLATVILIAMGLYMFIIARKYSGDKETFAFSYFFYFIIYIYIFSFWWLHAIYVKIFGGNLHFGGLKWNKSLRSKLLSRSQ